MRDRLPLMLAALWWGSLSAIGFIAVPLLFAHLPSPALAGNTAAQLFTAQTWVSLVCGVGLLLALKGQAVPAEPGRRASERTRTTLAVVLAALLLALLLEYGIAARIVARQNLRLWHGLGSLLYVLQWLGAGVVLWRQAGARHPGA